MFPWQPKPIATVAGKRIYEDDAQALIGKSKNVSEKQAATVLADQYLTEGMVKCRKVLQTRW